MGGTWQSGGSRELGETDVNQREERERERPSFFSLGFCQYKMGCPGSQHGEATTGRACRWVGHIPLECRAWPSRCQESPASFMYEVPWPWGSQQSGHCPGKRPLAPVRGGGLDPTASRRPSWSRLLLVSPRRPLLERRGCPEVTNSGLQMVSQLPREAGLRLVSVDIFRLHNVMPL